MANKRFEKDNDKNTKYLIIDNSIKGHPVKYTLDEVVTLLNVNDKRLNEQHKLLSNLTGEEKECEDERISKTKYEKLKNKHLKASRLIAQLKKQLKEAQEEDNRLVRIIMDKSSKIAELEYSNEKYQQIINKQHELIEIYNEKLMGDG